MYKIFGLVIIALAILTFASADASNKPQKATTIVSLYARNESIRSVLLRLAQSANVSMSLKSDVSGYVTLFLHQVTLPAALSAALTPLGDTFRQQGGVYIIEPAPAGLNTQQASSESVLPLSIISAKQAAKQLRSLFPDATIRVNSNSNSLLVITSQSGLQEIRTVLQGIDVRDPTEKTPTPITLRLLDASALARTLATTFPNCNFRVISPQRLLANCRPQDAAAVASTISALDAPAVTPAPPPAASEVVRVVERSPQDLARVAESQISGLRAAVSGATVVLTGSPDAVSRGKALLSSLDVPAVSSRYLQVYKIKTLDAASVADLLQRSIPGIGITVEADINAIAVTATTAEHQRVASAINQLDEPANNAGQGPDGISASGLVKQLITLKSSVPLSSGSGDIASTVTQGLQLLTPDVHVFSLPVTGQLMLVGSARSVREARDFISSIDVVPRQVVLDTEVLEVDETVAKNLGVQLGTAILSTTYSEATPPPNAGGVTPTFDRLQGFGRTPLSFTAELNLLIQNGKGRVLADPRITTLSGRTASIKAGDNISILTTTAGNVGTIATTQVQSFQTGVTLDITPLIDDSDGITVTLHPVVNSLIGLNNGIPEISTRDTQTTVRLRDNETLVIGGLIQENDTRTTTKLPILGDLPLLGRVFRNDDVNNSRNELVIVITPHIVDKAADSNYFGSKMSTGLKPSPLPTVPPGTHLIDDTAAASANGAAAMVNSLQTPTPAIAAPPLNVAAPNPTPAPTPSAFSQTNVYTFGSPPASNFARAADPVSFYYVAFAPTVIKNGTSVVLSAITSSNAASVKVQIGTQTIALTQRAPGQWQVTFPFPLAAIPSGQTSLNLPLIANRNDGASATISIPVNIGN